MATAALATAALATTASAPGTTAANCDEGDGLLGLVDWATTRGLELTSCAPSDEVEEGERGILSKWRHHQ